MEPIVRQPGETAPVHPDSALGLLCAHTPGDGTVQKVRCPCGRRVPDTELLCRRCAKKVRNGQSLSQIGNRSPHPRRRTGAANRTQRSRVGMLVAAVAAAGAAHLFAGELAAPVVTWAILAVTIATSVAVFKQTVDAEPLALDNVAVNRGERLRLFSVTLVHGDALHLIFNVLALWSFGSGVERTFLGRFDSLGGFVYGAFYLFACVASSYLSVVVANLRRQQHLSVGASGAVLVLVAFYAVLYPNATFLLLFIPMPAWLFLVAFTAVSLYAARKRQSHIDTIMTFGRGRVDHVGHLSGIAIGVVSAFFYL